jgi:hypothetical protein
MTRDLRRLCEAAIRGSPKASAPINEFQAEAIVRAVLTALREPSAAMIDAGGLALRISLLNRASDMLPSVRILVLNCGWMIA